MIQVLVVDDSAVVRQMMSSLLRPPDFRVTTASDPLIAVQKMRGVRPDVIVLDLEMPRMDGLTFLRTIMKEAPVPVVICSGLAARGTDAALTALEEGAVDIITKPTYGVSDFLCNGRQEIARTIRAAAKARVRARKREFVAEPVVRVPATPIDAAPALKVTTDKVIALGASTGGTEALKTVLESLPADTPGIVVVQHMPAAFTKPFAARLDAACTIDVREAQDGERVMPGLALIAPGHCHLAVRRSGAHYVVQLLDEPPVSRHKPSVDVLFHSVARAAGRNAVGVLMTGMGSDGADGLLQMRKAGARTFAQDEATSVVFGMPKEAIACGAAEEVLALHSISPAILRSVRRI